MLNLANLPDLGAVKAQVDRIDAAVHDTLARLERIEALLQALASG